MFDIPDYSAVDPTIWDSEQSATLFINGLYGGGDGSFGSNAAGGLETTGSQGGLFTGEFTISDGTTFSTTYYSGIRSINIAIEMSQKGKMPDDAKNKILGQALFLRAQRYFTLVKDYGGVPLVLSAQDPMIEGDNIHVPRSTAKVCFEQIISDLNRAVAILPDVYMNDAATIRITKSAASAYLGRVWLTFASPLYNPKNDQSRWDSAYVACQHAKEIADKAGKGLVPLNKIWALTNENNIEVLWAIPYIAAYKTHSWESNTRPVSESSRTGGAPSCAPTWDIVKMFPMNDGQPIAESNSYNEELFWQNRDPRFEQAIAWNGCIWTLNGKANRRQWTYRHIQNPTQFNDQEATGALTPTGFYCRKMTIPTVTSADQADTRCELDWIEIRYAEVLLNLAEAANATGHTEVAYQMLGLIRQRAGIESGSNGFYGIADGLDKDHLRKVILDEKAIEFIFEGKRYWDLRRYRLFTDDLFGFPGSKINGIRRSELRTTPKAPYTCEILNGKPNELPARDTITDTNYTQFFTASVRQIDTKDIGFEERYYFFAIGESILRRSVAIKQTIGWTTEEDAFDPLSDVR
jgi:hypothetical protein